jgi:murein DD-endopeptidase MepM/ murein hydrolase activator NlpD
MGFIRPVGTQYAVTRLFGEVGTHYPFHIDPATGLWVRAQICGACKMSPPCGCLNPNIYGNHRGIDFGCPESTEVLAACDGMILRAGFDEGGALAGAPLHDKGLRIAQLVQKMGFDSFTVDYRHLSSMTVKVGQRVKAGDRIAYSGYEGEGSPYLHVEMRDIKGQFRPIEFDERGAGLLQKERR